MKKWVGLFVIVFCSTCVAAEFRLSSLDLSAVSQGWGVAQRDRSITSNALSIAGQVYTNGVGLHAPSVISLLLDGKAQTFEALCGVDDAAGHAKGSVRFSVIGDGKLLWRSDVLKSGDAGVRVSVGLSAVRNLLLISSDAGDDKNYDHADWAAGVIRYHGATPRLSSLPAQERVILTPVPSKAPHINGPRVYGARPGHPFIYRIPCTGERPIQFSAAGLPDGLALDSASGIITGTTPPAGDYVVSLLAKNQHGSRSRAFKIVAGDRISLTPQMGYNHWYAHYNRITQAMMQEAADLLISSGMADAGYQFVNIDDCWMKKQGDEPYRDASGAALPNGNFPDMKGLADYIHARGLKAGLYTSPGPWTCGGYVGAYQHEAAEARRYAEWGYDFLKYDWCSYGGVAGGKDLAALQKPYRRIADELRKQDRDIVLNLCQYGMGEVWKWGAEVGQSWRTGGDLGFELHRIFQIALTNCRLRDYNQPGGWNDPDYLQIGWIGNAQRMGEPQPCPLTPNEQYSFMALWCLMASPLFYSGDMTKLDDFTRGILCSPELIEINQDPLGQCARVARQVEDGFILVKELEDGSKAVGFCNTAIYPQEMKLDWADAALAGEQVVGDCWRQRDLGVQDHSYTALVPPRMVNVYRITPAK